MAPNARITKPEVQAAICNPAMETLLIRLRSDADLADERGYHAYARVLTDLASRVEAARGRALDDLEAV